MAVGSPDYQPRMISTATSDEQLKIAVTDSDSSASFTQQVKSVLLYNDGPNTVHYNRDATSTTNKLIIRPRSAIVVDVPITTPHFICASGETATVYCLGVF